MSPWNSFDTDNWESVRKNVTSDLIPTKMAPLWVDNFLQGRKRDGWNDVLVEGEEVGE